MPNILDDPFLSGAIQMYENANIPILLTDGEFFPLWASPPVCRDLPFLAKPDGVRTFLSAYSLPAVAEEIAARGFFQAVGPDSLFPGRKIRFYPARPGQADLYFAQVEQLPSQGSGMHPEGVSRILSAFSSQYRSRLSAIFSSLNLLTKCCDSLSPDERQKVSGYLERINTESYKIFRTCKWISIYTQQINGLDPIQLCNIELWPFLQELCEAAQILLEPQGICLHYVIPRGSLYLYTDPGQLSLILLNLFSNSCRFSGEEKRIDVHASCSSSSLLITVSDHGPGIPPDVLPHVFEPYFSYGPDGAPFTGNGLGLCIAKHAAAALGGELHLFSEPGEGARACLRLPVRTSPEGACVESPVASYLSDRYSDLYVALADCIPSSPC